MIVPTPMSRVADAPAAREAGEHRSIALEQQERADGERDEENVAVSGAVQEPRVRIEREQEQCGAASCR